MTVIVGFLIAVWLIGIAFFTAARLAYPWVRPWGWPWTLPLWPLCIAVEQWLDYRERRRLRHLKIEVWKR